MKGIKFNELANTCHDFVGIDEERAQIQIENIYKFLDKLWAQTSGDILKFDVIKELSKCDKEVILLIATRCVIQDKQESVEKQVIENIINTIESEISTKQ